MIAILNPGHSDSVFGNYLTAGKRSPGKLKDGSVFYEGRFNRAICYNILEINRLVNNPVRLINLVSGPIGVPLRSRIGAVNAIHKKEDAILISIHANASRKKGWDTAFGRKIFIATNASKNSEQLAEFISDSFRIESNPIFSRGIEKKNVCSTLPNTKCPAVLIECGFMNNKEEVEILNDSIVQLQIAQAINLGIRRYIHSKALESNIRLKPARTEV